MSNLKTRFTSHFMLSSTGLSFWEKFIICLPTQAYSLSSVLIHNVYIKLYTDIIGMPARYVSIIYFIFNVWNMLNDPVFGVLLDKMKYRPGRGKYVYVMRVTVPMMILMLLGMLFAQPHWESQLIFTFLLIALFLYDTAGTFFIISINCYTLLAAPSKEERIDISVIGGYVGNIISFFATLIPTMLLVGPIKNNRSLVILLLVVVVIMNTLLYVFALIRLKDKEEFYAKGDSSSVPFDLNTMKEDIKKILRMRAFWAIFAFRATTFAPLGIYFTAFLYYMDYVIQSTGFQATLVDVVPMLVVFAVYPIIGNLIKKIGVKKSILGVIPVYLLGYVILLLTNNWFIALIAYVPIMLTRTLGLTSNAIMSASIIDEDEKNTGTRKPGLFEAINSILNAPLAGLQLVIFTLTIEYFGFSVGGGPQSIEAIKGIRFAVAGIPILFCLVGLIPLLLYPYSIKDEEELNEFSKKQRKNIES